MAILKIKMNSYHLMIFSIGNLMDTNHTNGNDVKAISFLFLCHFHMQLTQSHLVHWRLCEYIYNGTAKPLRGDISTIVAHVIAPSPVCYAL